MTNAINPAISALLKNARKMLMHEHSLFESLRLDPISISAGETRFKLTMSPEFDDGQGYVHPGMLTVILDSLLGLTVFTAMTAPHPIATINLRTDYVKPVLINARVECAAHCLSITDDVAHVRGEIVMEDEEMAYASGAFIINASSGEQGSRR